MSKITNIGSAVLTALNETGMRQEELARHMKSTQASVSRMIAGKNRPSLQTLNALCTALKNKNYHQAVMVLIGHLHDEIESSGMLISDVEISPARKKAPGRADIEKYIDIVRAGAVKSRETASLLKDLAWLISHAHLEESRLDMVAEESSPYGSKK
jgi:transcriptional regulator with XRE-family HTH domain